jgi:DNA mismatch repair protein MutS2
MLTIGSDVLVLTLKRRGVVVETLKAGVYRVQVGAMSITAREDELEAPATSKKKRRQSAAPVEIGHPPPSADASFEPSSIDLHGLTVDDARNRVAGYISRAILAGLERVEIIHGIGTGRVKAAVTKDLRSLSAVRAVKPHPTNPGITVVYL